MAESPPPPDPESETGSETPAQGPPDADDATDGSRGPESVDGDGAAEGDGSPGEGDAPPAQGDAPTPVDASGGGDAPPTEDDGDGDFADGEKRDAGVDGSEDDAPSPEGDGDDDAAEEKTRDAGPDGPGDDTPSTGGDGDGHAADADKGDAGPDGAANTGGRQRRRLDLRVLILIAVLVLSAGGILAAVLLPGNDPVPAGEGDAEGSDVPAGIQVRAVGKVFLESGDLDAEGKGSRPLLAPPAGQCTARAWQSGAPVGGPVDCADDGSFDLPLLAGIGGKVTVEMLVPGHLRAALDVEIPPESPEIQVPPVALGPAQRLAGQVIDARGNPVADAEVQAVPQPSLGESEPWRVWSGADGTFVLDTLPAGPVILRGSKDGHTPSAVEAVSPEEGVVIVLGAVMDLSGKVVGDPALVSRSSLRLEGSAVWPAIDTEVAEDGTFTFKGIPDGVYGLEALVTAEQPGQPEYASIPLENVTPDMFVTLALTEAFRIPAKVVDVDGNPVPAARVSVGYARIGLLRRVEKANAEGRATLGPVVPGPYVLEADADGFLPAEPLNVDVPPEGGVEEQTLVVARPARIEGIVVDEQSRPVPGALVHVDSDGLFTVGQGTARARIFESALAGGGTLGVTRGPVPEIPLTPEEAEDDQFTPVTDEEGRFVLDMLLPGTYRMRAAHGQHASSSEVTVKLASGEVRPGVKLVLREGQPLTGRVRDTNGQPIVGASLSLTDGTVLTTDGRGLFDAGYRRGRETLVVRAPGMVPREVQVRVGDQAVDLEVALEAAVGRIEGRTLDGNDQPVPDVRVTVRPTDGLSAVALAFTDERGLFELEGLTPGPAELELDHPGYIVQTVRARISDRPAPMDLQLRAGWTLDVLVRDESNGDPVSDATVVVVPERRGAVDQDGRASFTRLEGRGVAVEVEAPGRVPVRREVRRDGTRPVTEVVFELGEGGAVEGIVDDDIGDPVPRATVRILDPAGDTVLAETRTDGRGRFRFDGVREGDIVVEASPPAHQADRLEPVRESTNVLRARVTSGVALRLTRP